MILEHCQSWVDGIPNADILNPQDYAGYVCGAVVDQLQKLNLDEEEHNAVVDAVQAWYDKQLLTAQPNEQAAPPAARPDADSNTTPQPKDNAIIDYLPLLYNLLLDDGVIDSSVSKVDFINKTIDGSIADVYQKRVKFKAFIKHIKRFFNTDWYLFVCNGMGLTHKEMQKYNTDKTADFENKLEKVLNKK